MEQLAQVQHLPLALRARTSSESRSPSPGHPSNTRFCQSAGPFMKLAPPASWAVWTQEGGVTCHKPHSEGTGHVAQSVSTCLGPMTPWVLFLAPNKLDSTGMALPSGDFPSSSGLLSSIYYAKCMDRPSASTGSDCLCLQGQTVCVYGLVQ